MESLRWGDVMQPPRKKKASGVRECRRCGREFQQILKETYCHYEDCLAERDRERREKLAAWKKARYVRKCKDGERRSK